MAYVFMFLVKAFSFFTLDDIERYSKRYMKAYKEEWIPGTVKQTMLKYFSKDSS